MPDRKRPRFRPGLLVIPALAALILGGMGFGSAGSAPSPATGAEDPVMPILLGMAIILVGAKLGGELFERLGLPAVLGELIVGVVIGNLDFLTGAALFSGLRTGSAHEILKIFAGIGAVVLLFEVGLESSVSGMMRVGMSATLVAVAGVIVPWGLGLLVGEWMLPESSFSAHLFLGAVLTATSVGITARVFRDLGKLETSEARIVLGAAVIDDVLGLIVLAIVSGIVVQGAVGMGEAARITATAGLFLFGAILLGVRFAPFITRHLSRVRIRGMKLVTALAFCFGLSWAAGSIGLAPIVGAFAAGLVLEEAFFASFNGEKPLHDLIDPISSFFVPVFFVLMGIEVRLESFRDPKTLLLAGAITVAAIAGKQVCGLAALGRGLDRLTIGVGMIPRGEVGLIFASVGRSLGVVDDALYSACVLMVIATTFLAPPALQFTMRRFERRRA